MSDRDDQPLGAPQRRIRVFRAGEVASNLLARARRQHSEALEPPTPVLSGLQSLDSMARSWWGLTLLVGEGASGKTTLAARIALETARAGGRVVWLGLGQSADTPIFRMLTGLAKVKARAVFVERALTDPQWRALDGVAAELDTIPISLAEAHGATVHELRAAIEGIVKLGSVRLVVVDDLGSPERGVLVGLEQLADDLNVPILAVVDLDRQIAWTNEQALLGGPLPQRPGSLRLLIARAEPHDPGGPEASWLDVYRAGEGYRRAIRMRFDTECRWLEDDDA